MVNPLDLIFPFLFLVSATVFNWMAYNKGIVLIQLMAFLCLFVGVVATLNAFAEMWYFPLMFVLVNLVLFVLGAVRNRLS